MDGSMSGSGDMPAEASMAVPLLGIAVAVIGWGTFTVPMKLKPVVEAECSPVIFQLYIAVGIMLSSWVVLAWEPFAFTWWGLPATIIWTTGSMISVQVIKDLGISVGQGVWGGFVALTSFLWGAFGHELFSTFKEEQMKNPNLAMLGLGLLIVGVGALSAVGGAEQPEEEATAEEKRRLLYKAGTGGSSVQAAEQGKHNLVVYARGLVGAGLVGVFGGSTLVPIKFSPVVPFQDGTSSAIFAVSFGICIVPVTLGFVMLGTLLSLATGHGAPKLHVRTCALPGMASGVLWNMGNVASIYAVQPPLGFAVGYPVTQSCSVVAGLLGILVYREIRGARLICAWLVGACVLLTGACSLGYFGSAK